MVEVLDGLSTTIDGVAVILGERFDSLRVDPGI